MSDMERFSNSGDNIYSPRPRARYNRRILIGGIIGVIVAFIIGILIGRFGTCPSEEKSDSADKNSGLSEKFVKEADPDIVDVLINEMKAENIRANLK